jgi:tripartite ATP-independent transporter DctP family solute receptor
MNMLRPISRRRCVTGILAGTALAAPALRTRAADAIQLKFATADTMQDTSYSVAQHFAAEVAKRTSGKYQMQLFVNGALGTALNLANSLQTGILDCAILTAGFLESFVPTVQVIDLPFIFKDSDAAARVLDGKVGRGLFTDMEAKGIVGLEWGWYGWRQMETRERVVHSPDDLRGLKMRIQPGPVFAAMFKAVGAIPVALDGTEVYLALSQKTVDGLEFPLPTAVTFKVAEVTKYVAMTNHVYNAGALMVSKLRWTQMTDADRTAFREAGQAVLPYWRETIAKASDSAAGFLQQHGMQITTADYAAFHKKMEPVYAEFRPKYQKLFDAVLAEQS